MHLVGRVAIPHYQFAVLTRRYQVPDKQTKKKNVKILIYIHTARDRLSGLWAVWANFTYNGSVIIFSQYKLIGYHFQLKSQEKPSQTETTDSKDFVQFINLFS